MNKLSEPSISLKHRRNIVAVLSRASLSYDASVARQSLLFALVNFATVTIPSGLSGRDFDARSTISSSCSYKLRSLIETIVYNVSDIYQINCTLDR